jgi:hypothetical protein
VVSLAGVHKYAKESLLEVIPLPPERDAVFFALSARRMDGLVFFF